MADRSPQRPARNDAAPTAPEARGHVLAKLPRGRDEELRVSLDEYEGHPFISLRVWARSQDGQFWPVKGKGLTVRTREVEEVMRALGQASAILDGDAPPPEREPSPRASSGRSSPRARATVPPADAPAPGWVQPTEGDEPF